MAIDTLTDQLKDVLGKILHSSWLGTALTAIICIVITAIVAHLVTKLLRKLLTRGNSPLPSSTIFINIGRVIVWILGASVILSTCFNIDISAAITALGIGGIAISLGFQDTLSNLIGGLQLSLTGLVKPGDHIQVGSNAGIVKDVTWRHTNIITANGESVIIPNSVINSEALIQLPPQNSVRIGILVEPSDISLDKLSDTIEAAVEEAVGKITVLEQKPKVQFSEVTDRGYKGALTFAVAKGSNIANVKDVALKAISSYARKTTPPPLPTGSLKLRGKK